MLKIYKEVEDGFIVIDTETKKEDKIYTSLPFKFGDLVVKTNDEVGWAMVNRYEDLVAEEVLTSTEKFSPDWEYAKQVLMKNKENPSFLTGDKLIDFLAIRLAINEVAKGD